MREPTDAQDASGHDRQREHEPLDIADGRELQRTGPVRERRGLLRRNRRCVYETNDDGNDDEESAHQPAL
jgi:hypothetical protein